MIIPEGEEKGTEGLFKAIVSENSPNLGREMDIKIKEAQQTSNRLNLKRASKYLHVDS